MNASQKKVKVVANATTGAVVNVSENNPEYGYVKLEQKRPFIDDNGFLKPRTVSTLLQGAVEDLSDMEFFAGQELDGNIQVRESLNPFSKKYPENDLKKAGETGIVCTQGGSPIYRKTVYDMAGSKKDEFVQHDNIAELRAAYEASKAQNAMKPNEDFSIG
tara:strand:- start:4867 stop:5349 length:483 start_codon:yes stop_codon:yes gene_type:complete